jgi:hypothetical protein
MNAGFFLPSNNNNVALIQGIAGVECAAVACAFKQMYGAGIGCGLYFTWNVPAWAALGASRNVDQVCAP